MSRPEQRSPPPRGEYDIEDVLNQLDKLEETVTSSEERESVRRTKRMVERIPGSDRIKKYTGRDVAEGFIGGIIFSLPLLVEDGVFEIAEWFVDASVGPIPILLVVNVLAIVVLVAALLYFTDIRDVQLKLISGFIPRRLVGVLVISFIVAFLTMFLWGRLNEGTPSNLERLGRVTVIWAAAALGATLADIIPGESQGEDLGALIDELGDGSEDIDE